MLYAVIAIYLAACFAAGFYTSRRAVNARG